MSKMFKSIRLRLLGASALNYPQMPPATINLCITPCHAQEVAGPPAYSTVTDFAKLRG
jgi:hypothetical protein